MEKPAGVRWEAIKQQMIEDDPEFAASYEELTSKDIEDGSDIKNARAASEEARNEGTDHRTE